MDKISVAEVAKHFGYDQVSNFRGYSANPEEAIKKLALVSETIDMKKRFKIVVDYDPEYPYTLLQIIEEES